MNTRTVATRRTLSSLLAGGLALSVCGGAGACPEESGAAGGPRMIRIAHAPDAAVVGSTQSRLVYKDDKGNAVTVASDDESMTVTLNGEVVETRSFADRWNAVDVHDSSGRRIARLTRGPGNRLSISSGAPGQSALGTAMIAEQPFVTPAAPMPPAPPGAFGGGAGGQPGVMWEYSLGGPAPKVMLGITMDPPGEALAAQLGVSAETSTLITSVRDDLPAAKAGLQRHDIIVAIDGKTPADLGSVRAALREKSPGETLTFDVLRAGQKNTITVTLEPYEAQRLSWSGTATVTVPDVLTPSGQGNLRKRVMAFAETQSAELQKQLGELSAQMEQMQARLGKAAGAELEQLTARMSEVGREIAELSRRLAEETARRWPAIVERLGPVIEIDTPGSEQRFHIFAPQLAEEERARMVEDARARARQAIEQAGRSAQASEAAVDDRLRQIDERLNRLEELLRRTIEAAAEKRAP